MNVPTLRSLLTRFSMRFRAKALLAAIGATAVAAGVWLALGSPGRWGAAFDSDEQALPDLVAAVGSARRIEGRLIGGFAWAAMPAVTRGAPPQDRPTPHVQAAASSLIARTASSTSPSLLAVKSVALLLIDQIDDAVDGLEHAVELMPRSAARWSDLSAAYLARFDHGGSATDLPRALDAVETSIALEQLPEALFNRALILTRFSLKELTRTAWEEYLAVDPQSQWSAEARGRLQGSEEQWLWSSAAARGQFTRERLADDTLRRWATLSSADERERILDEARSETQQLEEVSKDRLIGDMIAAIDAARTRSALLAAVAAAHAAYGAGREAYKKDAFVDADRHFALAEQQGAAGRTPVALLATVHRAIIGYRMNDAAGAAYQFELLLQRPSLDRYPSIRGRALWILGLLAGLRGEHARALGVYGASVQALRDADEQPNIAFVEMLKASQLDEIGDIEAAWRARLPAFAMTDREGPIQSAALSASNAGWLHAAGTFYGVVANMARQRQRDTLLVDAMRGRARSLARVGAREPALEALAEARHIAAAHPEPAWAALRAEVDLAEADSAVHLPADAIAAADRALEYFSANHREVRLPETYLARARAHREQGDFEAAQRDLNLGIAAVGRLRGQFGEWRLRAVLGDVVQQYCDELVSLLLQRQNADEAFEVAERLRAWELRQQVVGVSSATTTSTISTRVPTDSALLSFLVGADETYLWVIRREATRFVRIPAGRQRLARLVKQRSAGSIEAASELRRLLLEPVHGELARVRNLVIVPDGPLHLLAFASLPGGETRYLIEEHVVSLSPSASLFGTTPSAERESRESVSALVVGNPTFDRAVFATLRDLPGASIEAEAVASLYPASTLLTGQRATKPAVLADMPHHAVFHFAGHSVVNVLAPSESALVLSGSGDGVITANDVSRMALHRVRLVMLSSCDSMTGPTTRSEGPLGLARAFLAAGVGTVVASQTPVDDRSALELSKAFHHAMKSGSTPAAALREAQLALLRSPDPTLSAPKQWATFVVIGASSASYSGEQKE